MTSDEQTRTAPRTAAGRGLVKRLWPDAALWADIKKVELTRAILAVEAEAAASREVPPEPPLRDPRADPWRAVVDRAAPDPEPPRHTLDCDCPCHLRQSGICRDCLTRSAPSSEPPREAAHVWFGNRGFATGGSLPAPSPEPVAAPPRAHRAVCANDDQPWPCHHITRLTEAGALRAEPGADVVAALRERLAAIEHDQWMAWAGTVMARESLSSERVERWMRFMVPYAELDEATKDFDREWADKVLAALGATPAPEDAPAHSPSPETVDSSPDSQEGR